MSDRWAVMVAVCAAAGALRPSSLPLAIGGLIVVTALLVRRPGLLCLGAVALVSTLAGRSLAGLDELATAAVVAEVTILSDPVPSFGGIRADVRLGGRRLELQADGVAADALRARLAGERITIRGEVQPVPAGSPWLTARHVSGRLRVYAVESWRPGGAASQIANALRRLLVDGAEPLTPSQRSLYTGVVIGDDRAQPAELADDFRGAGLTHLLAVSGQNVAFVMTLAGPLLRRLRLWSRLGVTLAVIGMFAVMTRAEPSVLRAAVMAALATTLTTMGGPVARLRVLALAVTTLLVVDPLLIRSVGFQLSVAAAMAIVVIAPRLADALPGPLVIRDAAAVTVAAQLGVAPVLLATFGPLPVASFPANLLAVPAAGPVMVWGLTAGLAAGMAPAWGAQLLQQPTRLLLVWLAEVAQRASALPLGELQARHVLGLMAGLALAVWARRSEGGMAMVRCGRVGFAVAVGSVLVAVISAQAPAPLRSGLLPGLVRWHAGSTDVVVLGGVGGRGQLGASTVLGALRAAGVRSIDLLVIADPSVSPGVVAAVEARHPLGVVVLAGGVTPFSAVAPVVPGPRPGAVVRVGALEVRFTATADRLVVDASPRGPPEGPLGSPR
jgi:competence protein ComEC